MAKPSAQDFDFVIVGRGLAGLRAALELGKSHRVALLTKGQLNGQATRCSPASPALTSGEDVEITVHEKETLRAGDGLCKPDAVHSLMEKAPAEILRVLEWNKDPGNKTPKLKFTQDPRHAGGCALQGNNSSVLPHLFQILLAKTRALPNVQIKTGCKAVDLIAEGGRVHGVHYLDLAQGTFHQIRAQAVLLACGGHGRIFDETAAPPTASGDGLAMAWRAGALLRDLEFIQFHPTALCAKGAPRLLMPNALRDEGARLLNVELENFMPHYHEAGNMAPPAVVARAIMQEMARRRSQLVYLDATALDWSRLKPRFASIYEACQAVNLDITADLIPVHPAVCFSIGGVATDTQAATSLPGLFAAGEVASCGVHGASHISSNSLLESLVMGAAAAHAMLAGKGAAKLPQPARKPDAAAETPHSKPAADALERCTDLEACMASVRTLMWRSVGVIRTGKELAAAVSHLERMEVPGTALPLPPFFEAQTVLQTSLLVARSALARKESRGAHYRSDFPIPNNATLARSSHVGADGCVYFV